MPPRETEWARRKRIDQERAVHVTNFGPACQICGTVPKTRGLQWDHDHRTGAHRGWLCHRCNRALPNWVDEFWLCKAAVYLAPECADYTVGWIADPKHQRP